MTAADDDGRAWFGPGRALLDLDRLTSKGLAPAGMLRRGVDQADLDEYLGRWREALTKERSDLLTSLRHQAGRANEAVKAALGRGISAEHLAALSSADGAGAMTVHVLAEGQRVANEYVAAGKKQGGEYAAAGRAAYRQMVEDAERDAAEITARAEEDGRRAARNALEGATPPMPSQQEWAGLHAKVAYLEAYRAGLAASLRGHFEGLRHFLDDLEAEDAAVLGEAAQAAAAAVAPQATVAAGSSAPAQGGHGNDHDQQPV